MQAEPTVFVVDDDAAMRDALQVLFTAKDMNVATYPTAEEFLTDYDPRWPGCAVLDVRMPGMSGLELQDTLADRHIDLPIVFLSGHGDMSMAVRSMRKGAVHFLAKPFRKQELLDSVEEAVERDAAARRDQDRRRAVARRLALLSPRERQVLDLVLDGCLNKQIAARLGIAERTVEIHRAHIMEKMRADSVAELTRLVLATTPSDPR